MTDRQTVQSNAPLNRETVIRSLPLNRQTVQYGPKTPISYYRQTDALYMLPSTAAIQPQYRYNNLA